MDYKSVEEIKAAVDAGDFVGWQGQDYYFVISYFNRKSGKAVVKNFATLEKAKEMAQSIFLATGIVVGIEAKK